ncbi:MAG: hypothetical protein AB7N71_08440, partial [Phycisphaerae bacterium]
SAEIPDWDALKVACAITRFEAAPLDLPRLFREDADRVGGALRVAVLQEIAVDSSDAAAVLDVDGGSTVYLRVVAPGAAWLRLVFDDWSHDAVARVIVFDPARPERSPQTIEGSPGPDGALWSSIFFTNEVVVGVHSFPPDSSLHRVRMSRIVAGYRGFNAEWTERERSGIEAGDPVSCHTDASCITDPPQVDSDAVATWIVCSGGECTECSGTLINRAGCGAEECPNDNARLFLTAASCNATANNLHTVVVVFDYATESCDGAPPDFSTLPQARAEALLVNDAAHDVALLGIGSEIFANMPVQPVNNISTSYWASPVFLDSDGYMYHHPLGSYRRYLPLMKGGTLDNQRLRQTDNTCVEANGYSIVCLNTGGGPGSFGAPIFRAADNRVASVFSCEYFQAGCGALYQSSGGRIDLAEPLLRPFIEPVNPVYVNWQYSGYQRGTISQPLRQLGRASFALAGEGGEIRVAGGSHGTGRVYLGRPCVVRLIAAGQSAVMGQ